jgi:hypothetical protein
MTTERKPARRFSFGQVPSLTCGRDAALRHEAKRPVPDDERELADGSVPKAGDAIMNCGECQERSFSN